MPMVSLVVLLSEKKGPEIFLTAVAFNCECMQWFILKKQALLEI